MSWAPLVEYKRKGISERVVYGAVAWVQGKNLIHSFGGDITCYGRSLMKPYMLKVFTKELSGLSWEQKAISVSSHNGSAFHRKIAQSLLTEDEQKMIQISSSFPLIPDSEVNRKTPWCNPCSGEHAAIVKGCLSKKWPVDSYMKQEGEFYKKYICGVKDVLGDIWSPVVTAEDGCGLPTETYSLSELGQLYSALAVRRSEDWIWQAMHEHPELIGGDGRLDTSILKISSNILAKEGADGLLALSIDQKCYESGLGVVVKLAHGWDSEPMWFVAATLLKVLGFELEKPEESALQQVDVNLSVLPESMRKLV